VPAHDDLAASQSSDRTRNADTASAAQKDTIPGDEAASTL
jgi:hypothetical protein